MSLNEFRDLLARWASWIYSANRSSNGFALPQYAEYVGKGSFDHTPADDFDPEIHTWDEYYRTSVLPDGFKEVIADKYLKPRGAHQPRRNGEYFRRVRMVEELVAAMFHRHCTDRVVADHARSKGAAKTLHRPVALK